MLLGGIVLGGGIAYVMHPIGDQNKTDQEALRLRHGDRLCLSPCLRSEIIINSTSVGYHPPEYILREPKVSEKRMVPERIELTARRSRRTPSYVVVNRLCGVKNI